MGNYNSRAPIILGEEWVDIRDEDVLFSPQVNSYELGHRFTLDTARQVGFGRFYINEPPESADVTRAMGMAVYPAGTADQSGPIRRVTIPVSSAVVSGAGVALFQAASVQQALLSPGDNRSILILLTSVGFQSLFLSFNMAPYLAELNGKRILSLGVVYAGETSETTGLGGLFATIQQGLPPISNAGMGFGELALDQPQSVSNIRRIDFGDGNRVWTPGTASLEVMPWRGTDVARFATGAASPLTVELHALGGTDFVAGDVIVLYYAALDVIYCEEKRLAVAGALESFYGTTAIDSFVLGTNTMPLRNISTLTTPVVLPAGSYDMVVHSIDPGDVAFTGFARTYPELNGLRQLYPIPPHPGVRVDIPFPVEDNIGAVFTVTESQVLPQLSLHATGAAAGGGAPLTEPHVYGRQGAAQVWGSNAAAQRIYDGGITGTAVFPQVRFYSRRFGDTTVPLTLQGCSPGGLLLPGTAGNYASTPDNAALDIVGDIDLRADITPAGSWLTTPTIKGVAKWLGPAQQSYILDAASGFVRIIWSSTGANVLLAASTVPVSPVACGRLAIRATLDVDNGAAGNTATFYTAPTIAGPWTQLGAAVVTAGVTSIFSSTAVLEVGSRDAGTIDLSAGTFHAVEVINSVGATVANPDFSAQAPGTTVFNDAAGRTWTVNGTAAIVGGVSASSVSISVTDFDGLTEIIDGWKEVTLRLSTPPTMGGGGNPAWTWTSTGETAGNRWEIMAACAPALSGIPGNLFNLTPAVSQLGPATYEPPAGDTVNLAWMPQGIASPFVSGASADPGCDAVIIFSQDPPTITGITLTPLTQTVTGIGLDCGSQPCCIPSGIAYQRITWSAGSLAATGFGAYELQRWDTTPGATFETIMLASSPYVTGFNDFEARVGVNSVYRIRTLNILNFAGAWSVQVTGAPPAPGVTGGACGDPDGTTGALIFTSNAAQSGIYNAAYLAQWEREPVEDFKLPEADMVRFQPMYQRDGLVAFHGTERGLEQFARTLLIQAGAIDPIRLADVKTLRDLAWAQLPYVCVRDDAGDRWFANVRVPTVNARQRRTKYFAQIQVTELTTCPYAVDPSP